MPAFHGTGLRLERAIGGARQEPSQLQRRVLNLLAVTETVDDVERGALNTPKYKRK